MTQQHPPVFILGAQRSGTTLLRLMLNAHSQVAVPEEGTFWMPLLRRHKNKQNQELNKARIENYKKYLQSNYQIKLWEIKPDDYLPLFSRPTWNTLSSLIKSFYRPKTWQNKLER